MEYNIGYNIKQTTKLNILKTLIVLAPFLILLNFTYASELKLLCVDKGENVRFSECNPIIQDRTCTNSAGCMYCIGVLDNGAYCPRSINECNNAQLSCTSGSSSHITTDNSDNPNDSQDNGNQENSDNNTNQDAIDNQDNIYNDLTEEDQSADSTNTLIGASIGAKISVGGKQNKTTNKTLPEVSGNKQTLFESLKKNNSFAFLLTITSVLEIIALLYLVRINKKGKEEEVKEEFCIYS